MHKVRLSAVQNLVVVTVMRREGITEVRVEESPVSVVVVPPDEGVDVVLVTVLAEVRKDVQQVGGSEPPLFLDI